MTDNGIFIELFKNYNSAIQTKCEESLGVVKSFTDYKILIDSARSKWESDDFRGKKPAEYFSEIKNDEEIPGIFEIAAKKCDEFIPESFVRVILERGLFSEIEKYAFGEADIELKIAAVKILGVSGLESYAEPLMDLLHIDDEYGELIKETSRQALIDIGEKTIPGIEMRLDEKDILEDDDFHLIIALIGIENGKKSDMVFKILKKSFRKTHNKALAARCLSDYGDGRAVPLLRSYLEKNLGKIDRDTEFEIQGAVIKLGGSIEGL